MKKLPFILILTSIFFLCISACATAAQINDQSELMTLLYDTTAAESDFSCSGEMYSYLQPNHFRELYRALVRAGIDYNSVQISYNDAFHHIYLSGIRHLNPAWADCYSAEDARQAILTLSDAGTDIVLLCSDELLPRLTEGPLLGAYMARAGIDDYSMAISQFAGILRLTDIHRFESPYAAANDYAQFASAVSGFRDRGINDFYIVFDPALLQKVMNDNAERTIMLGSSAISAYRGTYILDSGTFHFTEVEYTNEPREICRTTEEVPEALRRMGAAGIRDFELIFPYSDVFDKLAAQDFYLLEKLEAEAGLSNAGVSYSRENHRIFYKDAEIDVNAAALDTLQEAIQYTETQVKDGKKDIHLFCTEKLFLDLMGNIGTSSRKEVGRERIYDLIPHAGILDYELTYSAVSHVINIHINKLFPGTAIVLAVQNGSIDGLSEREKQTAYAAAAAASAALTDDACTTARNIHDWICANTVYFIDEQSDEDDNAIGVILNGKANCDGYADAFYLIGTLAGLNVRFQHGYSLDKSVTESRSEVGHMWNLLEMNGMWSMVDTTWDDEENNWTYVWFNVGADLAGRMHEWNEDMSVSLAPYTVRPFSSGKDFFISNFEDIQRAVDEAVRLQLSDFYLLFADPNHPEWYEAAKDLVSERCRNRTITFSWNEKMLLGGFFDILW